MLPNLLHTTLLKVAKFYLILKWLMDFVIVKGFLPKTDPASNASNEDADDNNSSSL